MSHLASAMLDAVADANKTGVWRNASLYEQSIRLP